jgi:hypothetical protein
LIQPWGGTPPYLLEVVSGDGFAIGEFLAEDEDGFLDVDESYSVLTRENMPSGTVNVVLRVTDQAGDQVVSRLEIDSDLALNYFTAPTNLGTGSGNSEANAKAFADVFLGHTVDSPAKGKVLRLMGGDYGTGTNIRLDANRNPVSWIAVAGQVPIFRRQFDIYGNDCTLQGLKFTGIDVYSMGIITLGSPANRAVIFECDGYDCTNTVPGSRNQSLVASELLSEGLYARSGVVIVGTTLRNCPDLHGADLYSIESAVVERNQCIIDNPAIAAISRSWLFTKSTCYNVQMAYNKMRVPEIPGNADGLVQLYNAIASQTHLTYKTDFYYNTIECDTSTGHVFASNTAESESIIPPDDVVITNKICRNSIKGGCRTANLGRTWNVERQSFYSDNAVESTNGSIVVESSPVNTPVWFIKTGSEVEAASGVFDAEMKLTSTYAAYEATRGAQLRRIV